MNNLENLKKFYYFCEINRSLETLTTCKWGINRFYELYRDAWYDLMNGNENIPIISFEKL